MNEAVQKSRNRTAYLRARQRAGLLTLDQQHELWNSLTYVGIEPVKQNDGNVVGSYAVFPFRPADRDEFEKVAEFRGWR